MCLAVTQQDPSCSVMALDGNFGLVHKRRGVGLEKARHGTLFFHEDEVVQAFVRDWATNSSSVVKDVSLFIFYIKKLQLVRRVNSVIQGMPNSISCFHSLCEEK